MSTPDLIEGDPRVPHAAAPALANVEAVRRARRQATQVTCAGAIVPTVLAMQGMSSLAIDLLGFPVPVAVALAGFLELALVSFALLTRASALAGRPGGVDAAAVWGVSLISGILAGAHELVGPQAGGVRSWEVDPGDLIAAGVRLAAPLVAALLWERVLTAARREHEARSLVEVRRDRRLLAVAQDALSVRQLEDCRPRRLPGQSRTQAALLRIARRKLRRSHVAALRMVGPGTDLRTVLAAVGAVDVLPAATIVHGPDAMASHGEPYTEPRTGPPDQGEPDSQSERAIPDRPGPAPGGPGWHASPTTTQYAEPLITEPQDAPVQDHAEPVQDQGEPGRDGSVSQAPVITAAETTIRNATVLDLVDQGRSQRSVALRLGIARSTVARAVARRAASEVPAGAPVGHPASHPEPEVAQVGHGANHWVAHLATEGGSSPSTPGQ